MNRLAGARAKHPLRLGVGLHECNPPRLSTGQLQIVEGHLIDRADGDGGTVLGRHVAQRRPVGQRQRRQPRTEELHELADHAVPPQALGDAQHEVGGGRAFRQAADQFDAHHLRNQHRNRLAEHRRLGLDTSDSPPDDTQAVDHRRVRIGADQGVRIRQRPVGALIETDDAGEVFEIHLVHDAGVRRHDTEIVERLLAPLEEPIAFLVAGELEPRVQVEGVRLSKMVDLYRMVDHQLGRLQRVDLIGVPAQPHHRLSHGRKVDDRRHAGEVLQQDPRRHERDLLRDAGSRVPVRQRLDVVRRDGTTVLEPQEILEENLQ